MDGATLKHRRYRPGELLGAGAQAFVLRVEDLEAPSRALVAKVWHAGAFHEGLLAGEFALLSRLRAPGLVRAHDYGRDQSTGAPFLVEDFIDGPDARAWLELARDDRARSRRLGQLLADAARTLGLLHDAGFLHGDLKPAHLRIPSSGHAVLLDFGAAIVRARDRRAHALSPGYAAPELLAGGAPAPASDLYALGALGWACSVGERPPARPEPVRSRAPWLAPSLGDIVDRLLSPHPEDRPRGARALLGALGQARELARLEHSAPSGGALREPDVIALSLPNRGVRYLAGPAGIGKSHVLREVVTRALLAGRDARLLHFPLEDVELQLRLTAWLRGEERARPFVTDGAKPLLLALDELHCAPPELVSALEAFRCRPDAGRDVDVIATLREAPRDADARLLARLDADGVASLLEELGEPRDQAPELWRSSEGVPGFVAAALGRVPLTPESALERQSSLSADARFLLAAVALVGGALPAALADALLEARATTTLAELAAAGLSNRNAGSLQLSHPALAHDLAAALGGQVVVDRVADALLAPEARPRAALLLSLAAADPAPARRAELLRRAAERARDDGLRSEETRALLALATDGATRSAEVLSALDRATRSRGSAGMHPELLGWLEEAAKGEPSLEVLALRRRAEARARAGDVAAAEQIAMQALGRAEERSAPAEIALSLSTLGAVALYRADWNAADASLGRAIATIAASNVDDAEELARLHHNHGVVALFRGRLEEAKRAFEISLEKKRALGDRAGIWACLLNLGLALAQLGRFREAERALEEAHAHCRALGQVAGTGWCLAARADVAVRQRDVESAERFVAEAEHLADELPAPVRADLHVLRAQIALQLGNAAGARAAIAELPAELLESDALLRTRADIESARARLASLPADRRGAARLAIRALRDARASGLAESEVRARETLAEARRPRGTPSVARAPGAGYACGVPEEDDRLWRFVAEAAGAADRKTAALALGRWILEESGAERVFVAELGPRGEVSSAVGIDLDGLPIAEAERRLDPEALAATKQGGVCHQRSLSTRGGAGSRIVAVAPGPSTPRGVVIAEHRFVSGCFDAVPERRAEHWALLAGLLARLSRAEPVASLIVDAQPSPLSLSLPSEPSTVLPSSRRTRTFPGIIGESPALERAKARLDAAASSDLPVLIAGETGVGKELFARALHDSGPRAKGPFVALNCGAVPDALLEAELFGHARGSFTGAERARPGLLSQAEGGTLFLDEIAELPLVRQATLLRVLASKRYRAVGSDEEKPFDVRIVAATNADLEAEVAAGRFRRDLLYRLNVLEIRVPPLREREGDVIALCRHILTREGCRAEISPAAARALEAHSWPGNVRELEHQMQRVAALGVSRIEAEHLSREVRRAARAAAKPRARAKARAETPDDERERVRIALGDSGGNITRAAERLGLTRHGLKKKMLRLGLRAPSGRLSS